MFIATYAKMINKTEEEQNISPIQAPPSRLSATWHLKSVLCI